MGVLPNPLSLAVEASSAVEKPRAPRAAPKRRKPRAPAPPPDPALEARIAEAAANMRRLSPDGTARPFAPDARP